MVGSVSRRELEATLKCRDRDMRQEEQKRMALSIVRARVGCRDSEIKGRHRREG